MEQPNAIQHELTIEELDAASGGALYQPLIVVEIVRTAAIRAAVASLIDRIFH